MNTPTNPPSKPVFFTLEETAKYLRLDTTTKNPKKSVLNMCKKGELVRATIGRSVIIRVDSIEALTGTVITSLP